MKFGTFDFRARHLVNPFPLRFILTIPFALILVISAALIGYLGFQSGVNSAYDLTYQLLGESSARVQDSLDFYFSIPQLLNAQNIAAVRQGELNINDMDALQQRFLAQLNTYETIQAIAYGNEQQALAGAWRGVLDVDFVIGQSTTQSNFTAHYYEASDLGEQGSLLLTIPDFDPRPRSWYQAAMQAGHSTWTPIYTWINQISTAVDVVAPVYTENNELLGVLDVSLDPAAISEYLRNIATSQDNQIFIVDEQGLLVAASTLAQPYTTIDGNLQRFEVLNSSDPFIQNASQRLIEQSGSWSAIERSQQFEFDINHERQLAQITPYEMTGLRWWIIAAKPQSTYMAAINQHIQTMVGLTVVLLIISIGLMSLVSRWITRPILQLNQATKSFAAGDWSERLLLQRGDEIGELATSFNQMADELQQSTALLHASESRLRAIFENSADAIVLSQDGILITVNPAYLAMFGYDDVDEALGKPILDMIAPIEHDRIWEYIRLRSKGAAAPQMYETIGYRQAGSVFDVEVRISTYHQNTELYTLAILRDISEQKAAQATLLQTSEQLAHQKDELTERLKELNCLYQHSKIIEQRNIPLEVIAQQTVDLLPPAWQYPDITCARLTLEGNTYITANFKQTEWQQSSPITLDNVVQIGLLEVFYLEARSQSFEGPFLREERLLVDELARRLGQKIKALEADAALLKSYETLEQKVIDRTVQLNTEKERIEAILNHSVDGIVLIQPDFTIQRTNAAFDRLFACPPNAYLKRQITELFEEVSEPIISTLEAQVTQGLDSYIEIRAQRWDDTIFDAEAGIGRIKDEGFVCVVRDITNRKRAEDALRQALTIEKELGELKTRFVATASHEFRTPMATILALSETLDAYRHKMTETEIEECLGQIKGQVVRLKDIVDEVLLLSRIQARKQEFRPVKQNINAVLLSVIQEFQKRSDVKHQLLYSSNDASCEMLLDAKLLRQVITNLVSNAIKYSPDDKPIEITLECSSAESVITVRDYGIGIPEQDMKHLFEPFHRASNVGTMSGTGLGLVISKESIELHGGTINVESDINVGTTFIVSIPLLVEGNNHENTGD
jgi:PAS domain S-box-containing protein